MNDDGKAYVLNSTNNPLHIGANNQGSQLYLDNGGDVGIGDTSPSSKLDVNGKITCTDFQNTSDRRIKENIIPATDIAIMSNLDNLNLKVYTYTEEYRKSLPEGTLPTILYLVGLHKKLRILIVTQLLYKKIL